MKNFIQKKITIIVVRTIKCYQHNFVNLICDLCDKRLLKNKFRTKNNYIYRKIFRRHFLFFSNSFYIYHISIINCNYTIIEFLQNTSIKLINNLKYLDVRRYIVYK